jgi:hypothetical protein
MAGRKGAVTPRAKAQPPVAAVAASASATASTPAPTTPAPAPASASSVFASPAALAAAPPSPQLRAQAQAQAQSAPPRQRKRDRLMRFFLEHWCVHCCSLIIRCIACRCLISPVGATFPSHLNICIHSPLSLIYSHFGQIHRLSHERRAARRSAMARVNVVASIALFFAVLGAFVAPHLTGTQQQLPCCLAALLHHPPQHHTPPHRTHISVSFLHSSRAHVCPFIVTNMSAFEYPSCLFSLLASAYPYDICFLFLFLASSFRPHPGSTLWHVEMITFYWIGSVWLAVEVAVIMFSVYVARRFVFISDQVRRTEGRGGRGGNGSRDGDTDGNRGGKGDGKMY